jgi:hypothetical protein
LVSPYAQPRVWAVAPLRNESGSLEVDGATMADRLARQLENASNLDVLPVNRVLLAMEALEMSAVATPNDARRLLAVLECDGLLIGTITSYDPYDPPRLGLAIELFEGGRASTLNAFDTRAMVSAATDDATHPYAHGGTMPLHRQQGAVSGVSAYFDAAAADVREKLRRYAADRGGAGWHEEGWHRYRISMDLYSEFVTYVMSWRLLREESRRLARLVTNPAPQASR